MLQEEGGLRDKVSVVLIAHAQCRARPRSRRGRYRVPVVTSESITQRITPPQVAVELRVARAAVVLRVVRSLQARHEPPAVQSVPPGTLPHRGAAGRGGPLPPWPDKRQAACPAHPVGAESPSAPQVAVVLRVA